MRRAENNTFDSSKLDETMSHFAMISFLYHKAKAKKADVCVKNGILICI